MSNEIRILLESTSAVSADFSYGQKNKAAGYYMLDNPLHTVHFDLDDFLGTIKIQGTLELNPGNNDWVDLNFDSGLPISSEDSTVITGNLSRNITGNWTYIRAAYKLDAGAINKIMYLLWKRV